MPLFVQIKGTFYHIPSISSIQLKQTSFLKRHQIIINYHRGKPDIINYGYNSDKLQTDYEVINNNIVEYMNHIDDIPLFIKPNNVSVQTDILDINEITNVTIIN